MSTQSGRAPRVTRRRLLASGLAAGGIAALAVTRSSATPAPARAGSPFPVVAGTALTLDARPRIVDLGSRTVSTGAYRDRLPGRRFA